MNDERNILELIVQSGIEHKRKAIRKTLGINRSLRRTRPYEIKHTITEVKMRL